jgi:hypothetical protein
MHQGRHPPQRLTAARTDPALIGQIKMESDTKAALSRRVVVTTVAIGAVAARDAARCIDQLKIAKHRVPRSPVPQPPSSASPSHKLNLSALQPLPRLPQASCAKEIC